jgi:NitT/TauT family transport system substrate-binding protein
VKNTIFSVALILLLSWAYAEKVRVGLGYIPDVQFAPFYAGVVEGIYGKKNLEVEFQHGFSSELYPLLAQGKLDFVVADAEDVIALRSQDLKAAPFKYVLALYQAVPNVMFSKAEKGIRSVRDLKGKTIGIPGLFGTSYTSLQAMLRVAGLKESDVKIQQIGFTQAEAILANRVDVAVGFINNEPLVLGAQGIKLNLIPAGPYNKSPGNGVIASEKTLENADLSKRFVGATQEAMALTIKQPRKAFEAAKKYVQNLDEARYKVLEASLKLYQSDYSRKQGLGFSNPAAWESSLQLLKLSRRVNTPLPATEFYSNAFLTPDVR